MPGSLPADGSTNWWAVIQVAAWLLALLHMPSVLLRRRGRPTAALGWLLTLWLLPLLGVALWWLLGRDHLARKRRRRRAAHSAMAESLAAVRRAVQVSDSAFPLKAIPGEIADSVFPPTAGNRVRLLVDAATAYPAMEESIRSASTSIHLQYYIWQPDDTGRRFRDLLIEKARQGVEVRALYDTIGSLRAHGRFLEPLREAGARVAAFLPPRLGLHQPTINFRNHRKILVVDGRQGFTGGLNIGDEHLGDWHDVAIRITGPAVAQLQEVFVDDWHFATGEDLASAENFTGCLDPAGSGDPATTEDPDARIGVIASGPDNAPDNPTRDAFFIAIGEARRSIRIMTPYFIPDEAMLTALRAACLRGVDVRVIVPARNDVRLVRLASRSYYPDLLRAGVRIFEYRPGMVHAKVMVVDDELCAIGSANMDSRSFRLNFEITAFLAGPRIVAEVAAMFDGDQQQSREVRAADLEHGSRWMPYVDAAAHLLSPLL